MRRQRGGLLPSRVKQKFMIGQVSDPGKNEPEVGPPASIFMGGLNTQ